MRWPPKLVVPEEEEGLEEEAWTEQEFSERWWYLWMVPPSCRRVEVLVAC